MSETLERLPGLPLGDALSALRRMGLPDARIVATSAPARPGDAPRDDALAPDTDARSTRVLAVRDGGRTLGVARFRTGDPRKGG